MAMRMPIVKVILVFLPMCIDYILLQLNYCTKNFFAFEFTENLVEAFVKFLEHESQPRANKSDAPALLNMNTPSTSSEDNRPVQAIQPILLPEAMLQTFNAPRNSSSILKDILNDS